MHVSPRSTLSIAAVLAILCTAAVVRSYRMQREDVPVRVAWVKADSDVRTDGVSPSKKDVPEPAAWFLEEEDEVNMMPERAEEAKEDQEELREEAEEKGSSTKPHADGAGSTMLRAHIEVIGARDPSNGKVPQDPCKIDVAPFGDSTRPVHIEIQYATALRNEGSGETRSFQAVANSASCSMTGGFYMELPTRFALCPASCDWVKSANVKQLQVLVRP